VSGRLLWLSEDVRRVSAGEKQDDGYKGSRSTGGMVKRARSLIIRAGRDASRSFVTGCFQTHLTHDLRGLTSDQMQVSHTSLAHFPHPPALRDRAHARTSRIGDRSSKITQITAW